MVRPHKRHSQLPDFRPRLIAGLMAVVIGLSFVGVALASDLSALAQLRSVLPPGHYLVLLQNNAELRPSGGFIGSFATVDITDSGYKNLRIDTNIYKRDNAFAAAHIVTPPKPLQGVAAKNAWTMRDSNWDLDFRDAAERVSWFYLQEAGEPVDGVIAVNATVLQDLLTVTGPIPLGDSADEMLSAETFFDTLAYKIEKEYFYNPTNRLQNEPKSILKKLVPTLQKVVLRPAIIAKLRPLAIQELSQRQIQLFHTDPKIELTILTRGWGGVLSDTSGDYLLVNNASVGGQKSSLRVRQETTVTLTREGNQTNHHVLIKRTHTGDGVWPDHTNNNYVRLAVPASSKLIRMVRNQEDVLSEADIENVRGKSVFGIHLDTEPGASSELKVDYRTSGVGGGFLYQKQSGILTERLTVQSENQVFFDGLITTDKYVEIS